MDLLTTLVVVVAGGGGDGEESMLMPSWPVSIAEMAKSKQLR